MSGFDDYRAVDDERRRISGRSNEWACLNDCSELTANVFRDYDELIGCPSCNLMINNYNSVSEGDEMFGRVFYLFDRFSRSS